MTGAEIATEARTWIGTPYHHQAAVKGVGVDCIGLVAGVAKRLGVPEADAWFASTIYRGYSAEPNPQMLLAATGEFLEKVPNAFLFLGYVVLFAIKGHPMHFGLISSEKPLRIIHSWKTIGRVVEQGIDAKWRHRIHSVFRLRSMA